MTVSRFRAAAQLTAPCVPSPWQQALSLVHHGFAPPPALRPPLPASDPGDEFPGRGFRCGPWTGIIHTEEVPGRAEEGTYNTPL